MKIKLHWKLFKNKDLVFIYPDITIFLTNLQKVKIMDDYTIWTGPGDCILEIPNNHISRFKLSLYKEFIVLTLQEKSLHLDGMMAFMMFDTYGFPLELTEEIAAESGFTVDTDGFYVMQQLHKLKSG